ncbi:MAG: iron-sulfur cluster assembly scaffold protein [Gammaproteobacteria bacterium]|jgi:NifU-like protein involved in Fe-S cluster formation|nr:iron-sulfur cluster assembly scaffold protein [Gammaproteobacteria bacterium]
MQENAYEYPEPVWQLFRQTPRAGRFAPDSGTVLVGEARTPAADSVLRLELLVEDGAVADARFQAHGCPVSIAVGAWLADHSVGRGRAELDMIRSRQLIDTLEIPEDRAHCAFLGEDALRHALEQWP